MKAFPSSFFKQNRQQLINSLPDNSFVALIANGTVQSRGDSALPFSQDASFWYYSGINEADTILVFNSREEYIITPKRSHIREIFEGKLDHSSLAKISGVEDIADEKAGWLRLKATLGNTKLATIAPNKLFYKYTGIYPNPSRARFIAKVKKDYQGSVSDIAKDIAAQRMIKHPLEIEAIKEAIKITKTTLAEVETNLENNKYDYEYQMAADIDRSYKYSGAGVAFDTIVASGKNATILHYSSLSSKIKAGDLIIIDTGAEINNYAADITRTISTAKKLEPRKQAIVDSVKKSQNYAISLLKPGINLKVYEQQVLKFITNELVGLNIIKKPDERQARQYYPHSCSHFLGLNVHDVGLADKPLKPGCVLTVEPGLYIPEENIGVRIEDDVLITKNGCEVI